jgi:hypothetical protein
LTVDESVVRRVLAVLRKKSNATLYDLYQGGRRRDGAERNPICGKGTVDKIRRLYTEGSLTPYLEYLDSMATPGVAGDLIPNLDESMDLIGVGRSKGETLQGLRGSVLLTHEQRVKQDQPEQCRHE